jgi:hypothetical protein
MAKSTCVTAGSNTARSGHSDCCTERSTNTCTQQQRRQHTQLVCSTSPHAAQAKQCSNRIGKTHAMFVYADISPVHLCPAGGQIKETVGAGCATVTCRPRFCSHEAISLSVMAAAGTGFFTISTLRGPRCSNTGVESEQAEPHWMSNRSLQTPRVLLQHFRRFSSAESPQDDSIGTALLLSMCTIAPQPVVPSSSRAALPRPPSYIPQTRPWSLPPSSPPPTPPWPSAAA